MPGRGVAAFACGIGACFLAHLNGVARGVPAGALTEGDAALGEGANVATDFFAVAGSSFVAFTATGVAALTGATGAGADARAAGTEEEAALLMGESERRKVRSGEKCVLSTVLTARRGITDSSVLLGAGDA